MLNKVRLWIRHTRKMVEVILIVFITFYSLCAAEVKVIRFRFFSYIPTICFYGKAQQAISKLKTQVKRDNGCTTGIIYRNDRGFKELGHIINNLTGEWHSDVDEIKLDEFDIPSEHVYYQDPLTYKIRFPKLSHLSIVVHGKEEIVMTENYSSNIIISKLLREAEVIARTKIIKIALIFLFLWLISRAISLIIKGGNIWW